MESLLTLIYTCSCKICACSYICTYTLDTCIQCGISLNLFVCQLVVHTLTNVMLIYIFLQTVDIELSNVKVQHGNVGFSGTLKLLKLLQPSIINMDHNNTICLCM